jgi:hypothetical protein
MREPKRTTHALLFASFFFLVHVVISENSLQEYRRARHGSKAELARQIVQELSNNLPRRRFLEQDDTNGPWMESSDETAHLKVYSESNRKRLLFLCIKKLWIIRVILTHLTSSLFLSAQTS